MLSEYPGFVSGLKAFSQRVSKLMATKTYQKLLKEYKEQNKAR